MDLTVGDSLPRVPADLSGYLYKHIACGWNLLAHLGNRYRLQASGSFQVFLPLPLAKRAHPSS